MEEKTERNGLVEAMGLRQGPPESRLVPGDPPDQGRWDTNPFQIPLKDKLEKESHLLVARREGKRQAKIIQPTPRLVPNSA